MDINSISSTYLNNVTNTASSKSSGIEKSLNSDLSNASDEELMGVCKEFEAYFIEQVFKNMKSAMVPSSESSDAATQTMMDYYEDSLTSEYAKSASEQQSNGLAQMLYEQMKRNNDPTGIE